MIKTLDDVYRLEALEKIAMSLAARHDMQAPEVLNIIVGIMKAPENTDQLRAVAIPGALLAARLTEAQARLTFPMVYDVVKTIINTEPNPASIRGRSAFRGGEEADTPPLDAVTLVLSRIITAMPRGERPAVIADALKLPNMYGHSRATLLNIANEEQGNLSKSNIQYWEIVGWLKNTPNVSLTVAPIDPADLARARLPQAALRI
jgi:hypothetical protein